MNELEKNDDKQDKQPPVSWVRLKKVIDWSGLSTNAFAQKIGLKRAENLYQIKKGNYSISKELADKITSKYDNINKLWLLTGEGQMFAQDLTTTPPIPYFDSSIDKFESVNELSPTHYLQIPLLANCDLAVMHTGDSMKPDIPSGSVVVLKEVDQESIVSGNIYLVMTEDYNIIRSIRNHETDTNVLRLIPKNTDEFDEITIEKNKINRLYLIKAVISMRST